MAFDLPINKHSLYIPNDCDAAQIESLTKARLIHGEVFVGREAPYLYVSPYQHPSIHLKSVHRSPVLRWQAIPEHYAIPCILDEDINHYDFLILHSGKGQLYWRCKRSDYIEHCLNLGAQWNTQSICESRPNTQ